MHTTINAARTRVQLSRRERQRLARSEAFSQRTPTTPPEASAITFDSRELELIDRLVRYDRTAVSSALLALAGIGAGEARRRSVLARVGEAACWAQAEGTISPERGAQIARHVSGALEGTGYARRRVVGGVPARNPRATKSRCESNAGERTRTRR
jgi:hypothetical protein